MHSMSRQLVLKALADTGRQLSELGQSEPVQVVLCGAAAGILNGDLSGERLTLDCDVIESLPDDRFALIEEAARLAGAPLGLKADWLNRQAQMYGAYLPLGWRKRLNRIDQFGPLLVMTLSRRDLLGLKLIGAVRRPQDLQDIEEMESTKAELAFLDRHLDRLAAESLDGESFSNERDLLDELRNQR